MSNTPNAQRPDKMAVLLEVARRANWDALHGPLHLRSGRFSFIDGPPLRPTPAETDTQQPVPADGSAAAER